MKIDFIDMLYYFLVGICIFVFVLFIMIMGSLMFDARIIEIQEVKQLDTGYYITINNEIYEYEVEK